MKTIVFFLSFTALSAVQAQNYGFMGRRNWVSLNSVSNVPVLANLLDAMYDGPHHFHRWRFGALNTGVHAEYGHMIRQNVALSLETGLDFLSYYERDDNGQKDYKWSIKCINIMPKVEFSDHKMSFPVGFGHQIGLGVYRLSTLLNYGGVSYKWESYTGLTLMYAMMLRSAVSKNIMLNYGVRYTLNYTFTDGFDDKLDFTTSEDIYYQKRLNLISLQLGVSYAF